MKKTVLITGATSGIGFALAQKFAQEQYALILVSSNIHRLEKAKKALEEKYPVCSVTVICQDLSIEGAAQKIFDSIKAQKLEVSVLVNNAGVGVIGEAVTNDSKKEEEMLQINMVAVTQLCRLFLQEMYRKKHGKILNVASVGAFQPGPYTAAYYASKAYVASYSRAIRYEAAKHYVGVCTLYPGTTRTGFFKKTGNKTPFYAMSPKKVAECAYEGLMKNKEIIVPGVLNQLLRLVPAKIKMPGVALLKSSSVKD
ncbi:MAG: SDR family oxidoreductase [Butyribacter sp.]|nr:SDR family oxidoreductase [bacterium]MDY3854875.1 SDR family oxidoreductase [Butyribacter sp.]